MEGPSDEDEQASDNMQEDDEQDSPPPPPSEVMMANGGNGFPNGVMTFHPSDGDLLNILQARISGHRFPTQIHIQVVSINPRVLDFFEPDEIRGYCRMWGSEEEQQEWYFLIQAEYMVRAPLLSGLTGVWKVQQGLWKKKYWKQGEVVLGERLTYQFFLEDSYNLASSPTSWRLYEYKIRMPPNLPPLSNQMWILYRMREGEVPETSSAGSGWSQQDDDSGTESTD